MSLLAGKWSVIFRHKESTSPDRPLQTSEPPDGGFRLAFDPGTHQLESLRLASGPATGTNKIEPVKQDLNADILVSDRH